MKRSTMLMAVLAVSRPVQLRAQGQREKEDSSATRAVMASASFGTSFLSLLRPRGKFQGSSAGWCSESCGFASEASDPDWTEYAPGLWRVTGEDNEVVKPAAGVRALLGSGAAAGLQQHNDGNNGLHLGQRKAELGADFPGQGNSESARAKKEKDEPLQDFFEGNLPRSCVIGACELPPVYRLLKEGDENPEELGFTSSAGALMTSQSLVGEAAVIVNPEPGTIALTLSGLAALGLVHRRNRRRSRS